MDHILHCHDITKTDFVRGQGCWLYDRQGRAYLDFEAGIWCTALGHSHPRVNQVIHEQIEQVMHLGTRYPNDLAESAALAVLETLGLGAAGKTVFLSSGSEAVEFAVQAARRLTGKPLLLTLSDSFLSSFGSAGKKRADEWHALDWRACADCSNGAGDNSSAHSQEGVDCFTDCAAFQAIPFEQIGAFVFEPGSASGWVRFPPRGLVRALAERIQGQGGLVVVNEVTTGMGRTGQWWGFQHYDLQPDLVAMGKGLGNGYPVSCVAMTAEVAQRLEESEFRYAQSHQNDPLGCAVARTVIETVREAGLVQRSQRVGADFVSALHTLAERHPLIQSVRGRGLMIALELDPSPALLSAAFVYQALLERGFLVGISSKSAANFVRFDPALIVGENEVGQLVESLGYVLNEC